MSESDDCSHSFHSPEFGAWQPSSLNSPQWEQRDSKSTDDPDEVLQRIGPLGEDFLDYLPVGSPTLEQLNRAALPDAGSDQLKQTQDHQHELLPSTDCLEAAKAAGALDGLRSRIDDFMLTTFGVLDARSSPDQIDALEELGAEFGGMLDRQLDHVECEGCADCLRMLAEIIQSEPAFTHVLADADAKNQLCRLSSLLKALDEIEDDDEDELEATEPDGETYEA